MPSKATLREWFDLGATKFRGAAIACGYEDTLPDQPVYPCPLCGRGYTRQDLRDRRLTVEDVPPKSVGGKPLLLTCRPCNVELGGGQIDKHAEPRERWIDSMTGERVSPFAGAVTVGGVQLQGEVWAGPGQVGFVASQDPRVNSADSVAAFKQALRDPANSTQQVSQTANFSWDHATLSYVRAAYLASFAAFGWSHIVRPAFEPIRKRLGLGEDIALPPNMIRYDPDESSKDNAMYLLSGPGPQEGVLMVKIARSIVVMPGPDDPRTLSEVADAIESVVVNGETGTFKGLPIPWPTAATYAADPDPPG